MSNVKTLTTIAIAALFAAPAFAQDADEGLILDTSPDTVTTDFASADLDQNGSLNADEFVTFAVMRAEGMQARTIGRRNPFTGEPPPLLAHRHV